MRDMPKTIPAPRGCGERTPGGVYVECGLSSGGRPLEEFLIDPPQPLPAGAGKEELANKPQLWVRTARTDPTDPATETIVMHPGTEQPIVDLLLWIGAEHYPYVSDYIEEVRRYGASRKLNPTLDLTQLTPYSRMILLHPYTLNTLWAEQRPAHLCGKSLPGHAVSREGAEEIGEAAVVQEAAGERMHMGPCLWKCYDLMPASAAQTPPPPDAVNPLCLREIGSTWYAFQPTGESAAGLQPGIFAILPITGFALIQFADGSVNETAKTKIQQAQQQNPFALPFYETAQ